MATLVWIYPVITWKERGNGERGTGASENKLTYHSGALGGGATTPCRCGQGCGMSLAGSANLPLLLSWKREMQRLPPSLGPASPSSIRCVPPGPPASTHPHLCRILPCPRSPQRQHHPPCCRSFFGPPAVGGETSPMLAGPEKGRDGRVTFALRQSARTQC